jgi:carbon storage regulator CsrA
MLVLTRKTDQKIQIGNDITITVIQVKGRYVRLGISAPTHIRVLRSELTRPEQSSTVAEPQETPANGSTVE